MQNKQAELEAAEYDVTSGGGMVKITISGAKEIKALKIDPSVVDPEDVEMLEDLIVAAVNEAINKRLNRRRKKKCRRSHRVSIYPVSASNMAYNVNPLDVLTEQFRKLPGNRQEVRTALRFIFCA